MTISNNDDMIDSRNVIARIAELEAEQQEFTDVINDPDRDTDEIGTAKVRLEDWCDENENELDALLNLQEEAADSPDWPYGEALIRDSYFKDYARKNIGMIDDNGCINWDQAARELQQDYTPVQFDGIDYWIRS